MDIDKINEVKSGIAVIWLNIEFKEMRCLPCTKMQQLHYCF